jgi:chromosomal replication initiation ATPase DnaA
MTTFTIESTTQPETLKAQLDRHRRRIILDCLLKNGMHYANTARELAILRSTLYNDMKRYKITRDDVVKVAHEEKKVFAGAPTITQVFNAVCGYFAIEPKELLKKCRKREIVEKRCIFIYLALDVYFVGTLGTVGAFLLGMHHTSIIHSRNFVRETLNTKFAHMDYNQKVKQDIQNIIALLS